jgi:hypothetical protein
MAQNSTVLWQWRSPYWCSELLSHQVRAHIKHSTITAIVSKIKGGSPTSRPPCTLLVYLNAPVHSWRSMYTHDNLEVTQLEPPVFCLLRMV